MNLNYPWLEKFVFASFFIACWYQKWFCRILEFFDKILWIWNTLRKYSLTKFWLFHQNSILRNMFKDKIFMLFTIVNLSVTTIRKCPFSNLLEMIFSIRLLFTWINRPKYVLLCPFSSMNMDQFSFSVDKIYRYFFLDPYFVT